VFNSYLFFFSFFFLPLLFLAKVHITRLK
jgi:hypothetical protein